MSHTEADARLKEMVLYISLRSQGDRAFGAVKLNKLLFYSDFIAYLTLGKAITQADYFALAEGPAPRRMIPVRDEMLQGREIVVQQVAIVGNYRPQQRIIAMRKPRLEIFSGPEVAIVEDTIARFKGKSGAELSKLSHQFAGWASAVLKETIPYASAMLDPQNLLGLEEPELTQEQVDYGRSLEQSALAALARHAA